MRLAIAALLIGFAPPVSAADQNSVSAYMAQPDLVVADGSLETAIGNAIRGADEEQRARLESELVGVALDAGQSPDLREMACRLVALCDGGEVLRLAPLLRDTTLTHAARLVIEQRNEAEAGQALLEALAEVDGEPKLGLINALAIRRSAPAVPALAALASADDARVASAAIRALGAIGHPRSLEALLDIEVSSVLRHVRAEAILTAAQHVIDESTGVGAAVRAVESLSGPAQPPSIRVAAFRLLVAAQPRRAANHVADWLDSGDPFMRKAAAGTFDLLPGRAAERSLVRRAASMSPQARALLLGGLAARDSEVVLPLARRSLRETNPELQRTAIETVGRLGSAEDVPALLALAGQGGEVGDAAMGALSQLPDKTVDARLMAEFSRTDSPVRSQLPDVFVARHVTAVVPALLALAGDRDAERPLRTECHRALGELADADLVPTLFGRLQADDGMRTEVERTLVAMGRRLPDGAVVDWLAGKWPDDNARASILRMIGAIGDAAALAFLTPLAEAEEPNEEARRAIISWTSPDALPVIERFANQAAPASEQREYAWRSLFRLSMSLLRRDRDEAVPWLGKCLALAGGVEDQKRVIEILGDIPENQSLDILDRWADEPELAEAVAAARESIHESMDTTPGR